jgi:hypothetical protein
MGQNRLKTGKTCLLPPSTSSGKIGGAMNESEKRFSFTRAAPSTSGRAKKQILISNWKPNAPPIFLLKNSKGVEHAPLGQDINMDDIIARIILGRTATMNPKMSPRRKKVFDVPKDDYLLAVSLGRPAGGWNFAKGSTLWSWGLSPTEK